MLTSFLTLIMTRHRGRENAVTAPMLAALCGCSERQIRTMVRELRRQGHPICADDAGYYYAATEEEYQALQRQLDNRAKDMLVTRSAVKRGWLRRTGKLILSGEEREAKQVEVFGIQ